MTRPMVRIHDLSTNEIIDREMNDEEYAEYLTNVAADEARALAEEEKNAARQALLEKLGITQDEAKLLLS